MTYFLSTFFTDISVIEYIKSSCFTARPQFWIEQDICLSSTLPLSFPSPKLTDSLTLRARAQHICWGRIRHNPVKRCDHSFSNLLLCLSVFACLNTQPNSRLWATDGPRLRLFSLSHSTFISSSTLMKIFLNLWNSRGSCCLFHNLVHFHLFSFFSLV